VRAAGAQRIVLAALADQQDVDAANLHLFHVSVFQVANAGDQFFEGLHFAIHLTWGVWFSISRSSDIDLISQRAKELRGDLHCALLAFGRHDGARALETVARRGASDFNPRRVEPSNSGECKHHASRTLVG
jgi:hypothetical protein